MILMRKNANHDVISSEAYTWDVASNLSSKTVASVQTDYTYDALDQLLTEARSGYSASYTYDANGNRLTKTLNSVTDTYICDEGDKLTSITRGGNTIRSFTYEKFGRMATSVENSVTTTYAYDFEARLTSITRSGMTTNTFTYNGLDTRIGKVDSAGTKTFKRDGAYVTDPVLSDGSAKYTPGISEKRGSDTKYSLSNYLGSTTKLIEPDNDVSDTKQYDAFGNITSTSGSTPHSFGFAGQWGYQTDSDTGIQLLGHRYYDPTIGRFLTRDPIKNGRNWITYCANSPIRQVDPKGLIVTALYKLVANTTGEVLKWGISKLRNKRYSKKYLERIGAKYDEVALYDDGTGIRKGGPQDKNALQDERVLVEEMPVPLNNEPWAGKGGGAAGAGAIYAQYEEAKEHRTDLSGVDWCPVVGDVKGVVDAGIDYLDSVVPDIRAGLQHTRIGRWLGPDDD